jgi:hypothetical protein
MYYEPDMQLTRTYHGCAYLMNNQLEDEITHLKIAYNLNPYAALP